MAEEEELAQLPGINIATAKKIVQRIYSTGGYMSLEQMCSEMKIKEHFRIKLNKYLYIGRCNKRRYIIRSNNDRIIDF